MWNDAAENTITFQFRFSRVVGGGMAEEQTVLAALVASWQSAKALEWTNSMTLLAAAAMLVAVLYAVHKCSKARKESAYQPIAAEEIDVC